MCPLRFRAGCVGYAWTCAYHSMRQHALSGTAHNAHRNGVAVLDTMPFVNASYGCMMTPHSGTFTWMYGQQPQLSPLVLPPFAIDIYGGSY